MDTTPTPARQNLTPRLPLITLLMICAAVVISLVPGADSWFVYDRSAIFSGEIWRMFTGHCVHFSPSHLFYDCLALGIAGSIIEIKRLPNFGWLCLIAPWCISAVLLIGEPQMRRFGGLSALATAVMVYLALFGLEERGLWRWVCLVVLAGVIGKIVFENATGHMFFAAVKDDSVSVSLTSHVCGVLFAAFFYGRGNRSWKKMAMVRSAIQKNFYKSMSEQHVSKIGK